MRAEATEASPNQPRRPCKPAPRSAIGRCANRGYLQCPIELKAVLSSTVIYQNKHLETKSDAASSCCGCGDGRVADRRSSALAEPPITISRPCVVGLPRRNDNNRKPPNKRNAPAGGPRRFNSTWAL